MGSPFSFFTVPDTFWVGADCWADAGTEKRKRVISKVDRNSRIALVVLITYDKIRNDEIVKHTKEREGGKGGQFL